MATADQANQALDSVSAFHEEKEEAIDSKKATGVSFSSLRPACFKALLKRETSLIPDHRRGRVLL